MERKLCAILSADVVGYSRLMEADEAGTLERLKANRDLIFAPCVARHRGRIFKLLGDGILAEFASAVEALECAISIQEQTASSQSGVRKNLRLQFRIGINVGDVITDGDDIYGHGVNVASRIQAIAPAAGIALSKAAVEQIERKVSYALRDAGEFLVKNVDVPIRVYFVEIPNSHNRSPFYNLLGLLRRLEWFGRRWSRPGPLFVRRAAIGTTGFLCMVAIGLLTTNAFGVSSQVCTLAGMQPTLSDTCGMFGLGGRPSREERVAWEKRTPGNCDDLRAYVDRYHDHGAYLSEANALLSARRVTTGDSFRPSTRMLTLYEGLDTHASPTQASAKDAATLRGRADADRLCRGFAATTLFEFLSASVLAQAWNCSSKRNGFVCGLEGQAVCQLRERITVEHERCG